MEKKLTRVLFIGGVLFFIASLVNYLRIVYFSLELVKGLNNISNELEKQIQQSKARSDNAI